MKADLDKEKPDSDVRAADADNPFRGLLTEEEYAAFRGVSLRTLQRDRQLRRAPPYIVVGKRVFYRPQAIRQWLEERERSVDRTPAAARKRRQS